MFVTLCKDRKFWFYFKNLHDIFFYFLSYSKVIAEYSVEQASSLLVQRCFHKNCQRTRFFQEKSYMLFLLHCCAFSKKKAIFATLFICFTQNLLQKVRIFSVFVLATLVALVACQNTEPNKKNEKSLPTPAKVEDKNAQPKFAYVNVDTLMEKYLVYKEMKKDFETQGRIKESDLRTRGNSFQTEVTNFQKTLESMPVGEAKANERQIALKEQEFELKRRELVQQQQQAETDLYKAEQGMNKKLMDNINAFIKKYAEQNGYTFIFTYSKAAALSGMMYGQDSYDVTLDVVKGLNADYKADKK